MALLAKKLKPKSHLGQCTCNKASCFHNQLTTLLLVLQQSCPGDILSSAFYNNSAESGGAHWINVASNLTVYNNNYTANNATFGAAGMFVQNVTRSSFINNTFNSNVGEKGAALFQGTCNQTTVANSTFFNNSATNFGGAVFRSLTTGVLSGNAFSDNSAGRFGGALYDVNVTGEHHLEQWVTS